MYNRYKSLEPFIVVVITYLHIYLGVKPCVNTVQPPCSDVTRNKKKSHIYCILYFIDGRKSAVVKDQLTEVYKQFLSDYAHNMMTEYVTDINDDSIKVTLLTSD